MYKAPVCFLLYRNPPPCAASFAGGSKPSRPSLFYKTGRGASFMILQSKFYRKCYEIIGSQAEPSMASVQPVGISPRYHP